MYNTIGRIRPRPTGAEMSTALVGNVVERYQLIDQNALDVRDWNV